MTWQDAIKAVDTGDAVEAWLSGQWRRVSATAIDTFDRKVFVCGEKMAATWLRPGDLRLGPAVDRLARLGMDADE